VALKFLIALDDVGVPLVVVRIVAMMPPLSKTSAATALMNGQLHGQ
jgi:hypothetical protein